MQALSHLRAQTSERRWISDLEVVQQLVGDRELFLHRDTHPGLEGALCVLKVVAHRMRSQELLGLGRQRGGCAHIASAGAANGRDTQQQGIDNPVVLRLAENPKGLGEQGS
ncbi:hypothetical protein [Streptomyces sp. NBC_00154]|uniref:hypothetical protein n=1 Tax=Streptomyces sp. NBC_00154 TaxID=2975670 RepID=UPI00225C3BD2|nr:hypothetical protein [Streptomyces sp. NBC_00154]MCX5317758.1 hypothetical protein [Streptomyces sp. NBC_00154]